MRISYKPLLWWAAAVQLTIAALPLIDPDLQILRSPAYLPLLPFVSVLTLLSLAGGSAALLAAAGYIRERWVPHVLVLVAAPIGLLAAGFLASGVVTAWVGYGVDLAMLFYVALSLWRGWAMPLRPYVLMVATVQILQGLAMIIAPGAFADGDVYGDLPDYLRLVAPSFVIAGAGMLAAESLRRKRTLLAFASLAALNLVALTSVFSASGVWTSAAVYGITAVVLIVAVPWRPSLREAPVALASIVAVLAAWDLAGRVLPDVGLASLQPSAAMMAPAVALAVAAAAIGFAVCFGTTRSGARVLAAALGAPGLVVAATTAIAAFRAGRAFDPLVLMGRIPDVAGDQGPAAAVVVAVACGGVLMLAARPRAAPTAYVILAIAALGATVGLAGLLAYMLDSPAMLAIHGLAAMRLHESLAILLLSIAGLLWAAPRVAAGPVGARVFAGLVVLVLVALVRSWVGAGATELIATLPSGTPSMAAAMDAAADTARLFAAISLVAAAWTGVLLTRTITQPLAELAGAIRRSRSGERRVRLDSDRADEIGAVMREFDRLTASVADANDALSDRGAELERLNERYRAILRRQGDLGEAIVVLEDGRPVEWTPALNLITGLSDEALRALPDIFEIVVEERREDVRRIAGPAATGVFRLDAQIRRPDGTHCDLAVAGGPIGSNGHARQMAVIRDVTDRKRAQRELERLALFDGLTGLPNRTLLCDRIDRTVRAASRASRTFGLLYLDLDRFKEVNDALGHEDGDRLLRQVAERLKAAAPGDDTVARPGGDEFVIIHRATGDGEALVVLAYRVGEALRPPFTLRDHVVYVDASVGIVSYPAHGEDAEALLRHGESAMYDAKRGHKRWAVYELTDDAPGRERVALLADLRGAIEREELELHFQPQLGLHGRRGPATVEALVRWRHPQRGLLLPSEFIPLAEESGAIEQLSRWVLREALAACAAWRAEGHGPAVAVNLSMHAAPGPELVANVLSSVARVGLDPSALVLEVTESWMMLEPARTEQILTDLASAGVRLSIDDFGTGYSSLVYLQRLPVHELKIDLRFVRSMLTDAASDAIVRSVIGLGHALGLKVVAEGVEDTETAVALAELGCDLAQGFAIARPMPLAELREWLRERERASRPVLAA